MPLDRQAIWQYDLWNFQARYTKVERFLPKNQHAQRKLLNFENYSNGEVSKSAITSIIRSLYFLHWCPIFESSPLNQFLKFNNFPWVFWSLGNNLSNFLYPAWKFHNPYCHNGQKQLIAWWHADIPRHACKKIVKSGAVSSRPKCLLMSYITVLHIIEVPQR